MCSSIPIGDTNVSVDDQEMFRRVIEEGFNKGNLEVLNDCFLPTLGEFTGSIRYLRDTFADFSLGGTP